MNQRALFSLLICLTILVFSSCRSLQPADTVAIEDQPDEDHGVNLPGQPTDTALAEGKIPGTLDMDTYMITEQLTQFSFRLFEKLSKESSSANLSFSPVSLNLALAAIYSGAQQGTRQQMSEMLGVPVSEVDFHHNYFPYFSFLNEMRRDTLVDFNLANRVFLEESFSVRESFLQAIETYHGGAFESMSFKQNPRAAEQRINSWAEDITRQRIKDLIPYGTLDEYTRLVLANAIYIKSAWRHPFEEENTEEKVFTDIQENQDDREFMIQRKQNILFAEFEDFSVLQLPYTTPDLSMMIILPTAETVTDLAGYIPDVDVYKAIIDKMRGEDVHMEIPRFTMESELSLSGKLKEMGMDQAFDNRADFSGISTEEDLQISEVLQKVFFEIDEKGSEAAAATAIVVVTTAFDPDMHTREPKKFIANRPFIFILKENRYHTPLFIGQVVK